MERVVRVIILYFLILHSGQLPWKNMQSVPESLLSLYLRFQI